VKINTTSHQGGVMSSQISTLVTKLRTGAPTPELNRDTESSVVHLVHIPVPTDLFHELKTMSAVYGVDSNSLAGELLTIALSEALESLPKDEQGRLKGVREAYEHEEHLRQDEELRYDAGGT